MTEVTQWSSSGAGTMHAGTSSSATGSSTAATDTTTVGTTAVSGAGPITTREFESTVTRRSSLSGLVNVWVTSRARSDYLTKKRALPVTQRLTRSVPKTARQPRRAKIQGCQTARASRDPELPYEEPAVVQPTKVRKIVHLTEESLHMSRKVLRQKYANVQQEYRMLQETSTRIRWDTRRLEAGGAVAECTVEAGDAEVAECTVEAGDEVAECTVEAGDAEVAGCTVEARDADTSDVDEEELWKELEMTAAGADEEATHTGILSAGTVTTTSLTAALNGTGPSTTH